MEFKRKIFDQEERLLDYLVSKSQLKLSKDWKEKLLVEPMDDGNMGSLNLYLENNNEQRLFGRKGSECSFFDEDGVKVIATLNLDDKGFPFELDIWKTNFDRVLKIPNKFDNNI